MQESHVFRPACVIVRLVMTSEPILVSKKASAKLLGISIGLLDKLRRQGRIEGVPIGKRIMFRREDVERLA